MKVLQIFLFMSLLWLTACQPDENLNIDDDIVDINDVIDDQSTTATDPSVNAISVKELGRLLFWDPIMSGQKDVACATCHHPDFGYTDGRALPIGVGGQGLGPARIDVTSDDIGLAARNSPTIINTAFNGMDRDGDLNPLFAPMFWDSRANGLEEQALLPLHSFEEMRGHAYEEIATIDSVMSRLQAIPRYRQLFAQAFNQNNPITESNIAHAIAEFERSIIATNSPFDRFIAGDESAMTQQQQRGQQLFNAVGCIACHRGPMFSDFRLHTLGVPDNPLRATTDDGANGDYDFRTPTLRNLDETGPYFHNGIAGTLQEVLGFYRTASRPGGPGGPGGGGPNNNGLNINTNVNPNQIDQRVRNLGPMNNNDIQNIIAFIEALNDPDFDRVIPDQVPSGLNPGGAID